MTTLWVELDLVGHGLVGGRVDSNSKRLGSSKGGRSRGLAGEVPTPKSRALLTLWQTIIKFVDITSQLIKAEFLSIMRKHDHPFVGGKFLKQGQRPTAGLQATC